MSKRAVDYVEDYYARNPRGLSQSEIQEKIDALPSQFTDDERGLIKDQISGGGASLIRSVSEGIAEDITIRGKTVRKFRGANGRFVASAGGRVFVKKRKRDSEAAQRKKRLEA